GRGTFVTKAPEVDRWIQLATDWESLIAPIRDNVPHMLPGGGEPPPRIEPDDGIPAPGYVFIRSVQKRAGRVYAFARVHVAKHIHARAPKQFASRVALAVLSEMKDLEISRAHQTLAIGAADIETARNLGIALNAPTAEARCVVTDASGMVIYVGEITYPGDCVRLNIELIRQDRGRLTTPRPDRAGSRGRTSGLIISRLRTVQIPCLTWAPLELERGRFMSRAHALLAAVLVALSLSALPAAADKRVALVIGNSAYVSAPALANPVNDASDIAAALQGVGFEVILGTDLAKPAFDGKVRDFARILDRADVALLFYAGHGLQVAGRNYLIPVDAKLQIERDLDFEAISVDFVLKQMELEREGKTNVVFLDACRDNPLARNLARSMGTRSASIGQGLAQVQTGVGTFIAYSTQPGNVALDGQGRNSPFTA